MSTLDAIQPYVEQLFDDSDVQRKLQRAANNLRAAGSRAGSAKSKKKLVTDQRLRRRVADGMVAAFAAGRAIQQGAEKQRKRSRRGRMVMLLGVAAGAAAAASPDVRNLVMQQFRGQEQT